MMSIKPEDLTKGWFADGNIFVDGVVKNKIVPYKYAKASIKAATGKDGKGGFEINESAFLDDAIGIEDTLGILE